jgi:hypothetical protein
MARMEFLNDAGANRQAGREPGGYAGPPLSPWENQSYILLLVPNGRITRILPDGPFED